jgi:ATP-dependent Lon protease
VADLHEALPLLPLTTGVMLPGMTSSIALETDESRAAIDAARSIGGRLLLIPRIEGRYASVGVLGELVELGEDAAGENAVVVHAEARAIPGAALPATGDALWVRVERIDQSQPSAEAAELAREFRAVLENILLTRGLRRLANYLHEVTEPDAIADLAGFLPDLTLAQRVEALELVDTEARLRLVLSWGREVLADLALRERVKSSVEDDLEKNQREFLLRRQLEAIRRELGESDDAPEGPDGFRSKLATLDVPDQTRTAIEREIDKLERTSEQSPEHGWIRTWLDTIFDMPWGVRSSQEIALVAASATLDADHEGLRDVKDRILEHLAVRSLRQQRGIASVGRSSGAIIALVGPPGVGKTSLGESIARALGRSFARVALGGVRDEAEIRGHRRTYVGAQPGRLVRAIRDAGTMNPVIMLDEVDKLGADVRGDPSAALLEVLDPAQNHTFKDHYLEVELDLSDVLFIATANILDTIPPPLFDRLEIIRIDGYSDREKVGIARNHLLPRQIERAGLKADEVMIDDTALELIISSYTREAGVRSLERELARLARKIATKVAAGGSAPPFAVGTEDVKDWLGRPRFFFEAADRTSVPGVATGLAVTGAGGDVLFIEASVADGSEGLTLTGQLGEVMRESAEIALSYVRSHAEELGIPTGAFSGRRFHLHVPAGAVPKDGPSAGVTMATALVSLLRGVPVRSDVAMTGELTLQGRVLPIGGVVQKSLAAHRAGIKEIVVPIRNEPDLEDLPEEIRSALAIHLAASIGDVLKVAISGSDAAQVAA